MKYMILECHPGYAVVLGDDGRFVKAANLHYAVGQTVDSIVEMKTPARTKAKMYQRWLVSFAAVAACLLLVVSSVLYRNRMPYASVLLSINPSVRIDVDRKDRVVAVEGVNADGVDLLADYDPARKDLQLVMDELVDRAITMGYLHAGGKITLNLDAPDEAWVTDHSAMLPQQLNGYLAQRIEIVIDVQTTPAAPVPGTVVIPTEPNPGDSDYGESDYGPDATEQPDQQEPAQDSDYGQDGDSGYDQPEDSPYDAPEDSAYEESDDDGVSQYETDDGSPYDSPQDD